MTGPGMSAAEILDHESYYFRPFPEAPRPVLAKSSAKYVVAGNLVEKEALRLQKWVSQYICDTTCRISR